MNLRNFMILVVFALPIAENLQKTHCENNAFICLTVSICIVNICDFSADLSTADCTLMVALYVKNANSKVGIIAIKEKNTTQSLALVDKEEQPNRKTYSKPRLIKVTIVMPHAYFGKSNLIVSPLYAKQ